MLKKFTSIILSIAMLMTGISVFAAVDTSTTGLTIYTDNFDTYDEEVIRDYYIDKNNCGYPWVTEGGSVEGGSDVFAHAGDYMRYTSSVITPGAGPDGTTALVVGSKGADISLMTIAMDNTGSKLYEFSYDIKFNKLSTMSIGGNSLFGSSKAVFLFTTEGKVQASTDGTNYTDAGTYSADAWYNVKIVLQGTTKYGWLIDANGNTIYSKITETASATKKLSALQTAANAGNATIDNAVIKEYDLAQVAPVVKSVSIADETDVPVDTNSATVVFSQPVSGTAKITGGAADITCSMTLASATPDNYTYTVSWTGTLAGGTTYTLDLSAVKNAGALAAATSTATFTTVAQAVVTESDSFETASYFTSASTTGYNYTKTGPIYMEPRSPGVVSQVSGYGEGNAIQIKTGSSNCSNPLRTTAAYTPTATKKYVVTYRFNLKQPAKFTDDGEFAGSNILFGAYKNTWAVTQQTAAKIMSINGKPSIVKHGDENDTAVEIAADHWYNIVWAIDYPIQTFTLIDEASGEVVWSESTDFSNEDIGYTENTAMYFSMYFGNPAASDAGTTNADQIALIDDVTIWTVRKDKDLVLTESTASDPFALDGKVSLTFNQPVVGTPAMYSLYQGATNNKEAYSDIKVNCKDFCTQEISFSALNYQTDYTLDYSGVVAASTADLGASKPASVIEFTTEDSPFDAVITGDVAVSGVGAGDTISFNLESDVSGNVLVIAALYKDSIENGLAGFAVNSSVAISAGNTNPVTVTLSNAYDANIIKLYVWTGATFAPLMPEYILLAD